MTWLWAAALALAVSVLVASQVRGRGIYPDDLHDVERDEP